MTKAEQLFTLLALQDSYIHLFGENAFTEVEQRFFQEELHRVAPEVAGDYENTKAFMHDLIREKLEEYRNGN